MTDATRNFGEDFFTDVKQVLESLNVKKDQFILEAVIKPYWPENVTPNHLTLVRFGLGFALFVLLFNFRVASGVIVLPLFLIGILTDLFDGVIARGMKKETAIGAFLDPIADRVLIIPIAVYSLLSSGQILLAAFLFFEIINAGISLYAYSCNIHLDSNIYGKTKMFLQSIVFMAILILWPRSPNVFFIYLLWLSMALLLLSLYAKMSQLRVHE